MYTEENAKLWREVLELMRETLGSAVSAGSSYWATDPLDNPDYEKFMLDFHEIMGVFPPTTTAQPMKDPARLQSLLKLSFEKGCKLNRISVLSIKILDQIHKELSAEELAFVGLLPQNPGGRFLTQFPFNTQSVKKVNAGRTFERSQKKTDSSNSDVLGGTIACLTGFLFNMVDRSVKLISPCSANERWPLGYIIFDQGTFSDIEDLRKLIVRMIAKNMPLTLREQDLLKFRPELEYESLVNGFKLSTQWQTLCFRNRLNSPKLPRLKKLGELIKNGDLTAGEVADI